MLSRLLSLSRYLVIIPVIGIFVGSVALMIYELMVVVTAVLGIIDQPDITPKTAKALAVGLIEAVDVFLIAIVAQMIGLGVYKLFIDAALPLPAWFKIQNLDDLKSHLASSVIAVLSVLFMREAVGWDGERNLLMLGGSTAFIILALTIYLLVKGRKD